MASKVKKQHPAKAVAPVKSFSLIGDAKLKELYARMLQCRALEERSRLTHKPRKIAAPVMLEAAIVGTTIDLRSADWIAPWEGDRSASFVKGIALSALLTAAPTIEASTTLHVVPAFASTEAQISLAVGAVLTSRKAKNSNVAVVLCHGASHADKHWREAMDLAAKLALPILFVFCEKAIDDSRPRKKQKKKDAKASDLGFPIIPVDAHDVVALYRVAYESIQKARNGRGPTLIEAKSFVTPKEHRRKGWADTGTNDPIAKMEEYLTAKGLFSPGWKQKLTEQFDKELAAATEAAR
jgi:TPP-dependent pyruvate/acetoin dehydrogenase alpha subunit